MTAAAQNGNGKHGYTRNPVLDVSALALAGLGNAMLAARLNPGFLALGLVVAAVAIRVFQVRGRWTRIPLQIPFLLFLVSAWIGVTVSYDPEMSMRKFELILGSVGLYLVLATMRTEIAKQLVVWGLIAIGAAVTVFFLTQTNFAEEPLKIDILNEIGLALNRIVPQFGFHSPHANLMAGIMLLALPFAAVLCFHAFKNKQTPTMIASGGLALFLAFGLLMTTSRGTWMALALVAGGGLYAYAVVKLVRRAGYSSGIGIALALNVALVLVVLAALFGRNVIVDVLNGGLGSVGGIPRLELYNQVIQLAQDYQFTGAGLDTFSPNYSTYEMLINVPLLPHGHNLLLQIWYEQGLLGLVAFVWMLVAFYLYVIQRRARINWLTVAGVAAVTMVLLHGLVDVVFYFSRVLPLMFIPFGLTIASLHPLSRLDAREEQSARRLVLGAAGAAVMFLFMLLVVGFTRSTQLQAQWTANQAALAQARIEIPKVKVPHPTPHEVRREANLEEPMRQFTATLEADSQNRTAHSRLGLIALDRYNFPLALDHLTEAYSQDPGNRAVIKALGYTYVWSGNLEAAKPLLDRIPEARIELGYSSEEWAKIGRDDLANQARLMMRELER